MIKGVSKHAVIVKPPDSKQFEQAIFILSGENNTKQIENANDLLELAASLASKYVISSVEPIKKHDFWHPILFFLVGVAAMGMIWLYVWLMGL